MKIGILTHYNVINNGATLQMFALKSWLEEKGHEVYILTYDKNYDFSKETAKKYNKSIKNAFFIFKEYFFKKSPALFFHKIKKHFIFKKFIKKNFEFLPFDSELDAVVVGSDEVFSLEVGCNKMMYGHGLSTKLLISYAPSFGQTDFKLINERGCYEIISNGLKQFDSLSVRDVFSKETVYKLTSLDCEIVCDPVILYDFSSIHKKIKTPKHKYILLYSYDKNMNKPEEIKSIQKYAKERKLKVYSVGTYHKWCDKNITCDPIQWIEYFRHAEEIITDTFHGSILSIIEQKKAFFLKRSINSNKISSLINEFELDGFLTNEITYEGLLNFSKKRYDVNKTKELVKIKRNKGVLFLEKALRENE